MANKIFLSWQSDTDTRTGRNFIIDVLERACDAVSSDADLEVADRDVELDSDTKGVPGRAPIVETIFKKIDACKVYIADVTFVARRIDGRPSPNPNVLIEYGWALKSKNYDRVITLMNTAYGKPSDETLPFNMKHIMHPITYDLREGASATEKGVQRDILKRIMQKEIAVCLGISVVEIEQPLPFFPREPKDGQARFCPHCESIGFNNRFGFEGTKDVFLQNGTEMWLRVIPIHKQNKIWPISELKLTIEKPSSQLPPLVSGTGYSFVRAEDGVGTYVTRTGENAESIAAGGTSFVFETGEIWGIDIQLLSFSSDKLFQKDIEENYSSAFENYLNFLSALGVSGPFKWIAGINETKGRYLSISPPSGKILLNKNLVCAARQIIVEGVYNENVTPFESLLPFFETIFEKCGTKRPDYLRQK